MTHKPDCNVYRCVQMVDGIEFRGLCTCDHQGMLEEIQSLRSRLKIAHALNVRVTGQVQCRCEVCK